MASSLSTYALCTFLLLVLVLLIMAHISRQLPSLLNESAVIYDSTLATVLLGILGGGVAAITNTPTTSPDIPYLIQVILILSMTLNTTLRTMLPKLKMVWSGQTILVSQLVSDHRQALNRSTVQSSAPMYNVSGLEHPSSSVHVSSDGKECPSSSSGYDKSSTFIEEDLRSPERDGLKFESEEFLEDIEDDDSKDDMDPGSSTVRSSQELWLENAEKEAAAATKSRDEKRRGVTFHSSSKPGNETTGRRPRRIVLREGEAPAKRLVLKLIELKDELDHVTKRITSGLNVETSDWELVKSLTVQLETVFKAVEFDWQKDLDVDEGMIEMMLERGR